MLSIMLVEANQFLRGTMRDILLTEFESIGIAEAEDGKEAIQKLAITPADLIFMGIALRGIGGKKVTEEIKATSPGFRNYHTYGLRNGLFGKIRISGPR